MLYDIIGFTLVDCQLLATILQTVHPMFIVKTLMTNPMLPPYLSVMPRRCYSNAMIYDTVYIHFFLKQTFVI